MMHAILLTAVVTLAGQVGSTGGDRYGSIPATDDDTSAATLEQSRAPAGTEVQPRGAAQAQALGQPGSSFPPANPEDYRSRGQLQPAGQDLRQADAVQQSPSSNGNTALARIKPAELISNLLEPPQDSQLSGTPLSLAEAVQNAESRDEQTQRVEAYWDLSAALADYYLSLREKTDHEVLLQSVTRPGSQWESTRQALDARALVASRTVETAQARLQNLVGAANALPIPADVPHCGAYDTRFEEIFSSRPAPLSAQHLHELLPLRLEGMRNQADHVADAYQWLQTVSQRRDPNTDGSGLLKAHELLMLRRRAFIDTLRSYNVDIARYAEIASPGEVGANRLVAMLIRTDTNQRLDGNPQDIRRTSAEETVQNAGSPRTFAAEQQSQSQDLNSTQSNSERSILRRPGAN